MAENFYTILTKIGKAKMANAYALGNKLNLVHFAVGDGNGAYYNPTEEQTQLKREVWRGNISSLDIDPVNPNWIVAEAVIPSADGGFMMREAALIDDTGDIVAIGKYPETYKPIISEGSAKDLYIKMIIEISNSSSVSLKIDPSVILATKKDIQNVNTEIQNNKQSINNLATSLAEQTTQLSNLDTNKADKTEVNALATEKANQTELNETKARIDTLVANAGNTDGNAELLDIRVDSQGNIFQTSGNRVANIEKLIRAGVTELKFADWEIGGIDGITALNDDTPTNRLRTGSYYSFKIGETLKIAPASGYKVALFVYNADYTKVKIILWITSPTSYIVAYQNYRFMIAKTDDSAASLSFADNVTITLTDGSINDGENLSVGSIGTEQLKVKSVSTDKCTFIKRSTINLIDKSKILQDYLLDYQGLPILKTYSNAGLTDFILVEAGESYTYKRVNNGTTLDGILNGYALYDAHKKLVSIVVTSSGIDSLTIPSNVVYIRIYFNSSYAFEYFRDECIFCKVSDFNDKYESYTDELFLVDEIKVKKSNLVNTTDNLAITRWGDSLTAQSDATYLETLTGMTVYKLGAGGETTVNIAGRMGALPLMVQPFTIPADTSAVTVGIKDCNGNQAGIMRLNSPGINPVVIDGVEGTLSIVQDSGASPTWSYTFARTLAGTSKTISRPVKLITESMRNRLNDIAVIWAGTNDGIQTYNVNLLIDKIRSMVNSIKSADKKYIVLGLTKCENMSGLPTVNQYLAYAFGEHYLELSKYLLEFGLSDAGITPTAQDTTDISNNTVPTSLRSDSTHLNDAGQQIVSNLINRKLRELGYIK